MTHSFDIVVVGAGPAGLAAAAAAAGAGGRVAILDDNPRVGGQIWRSSVATSHPEPARIRAVQRFEASGAKLFSGRQVVDAEPSRKHGAPGRLDAWGSATRTLETFIFDQLILTTGARERLLPFPGWTLPGVFGAGGLQAIVRGGYQVRGKRVAVAGTGPLLLAVAAHLQQDGAEIVLVAEQASLRSLISFGKSLVTHPAKILQGIRLRRELAGVPYRTGCWPVAAKGEGDGELTEVQFSNGSRNWTERCDLLACGFHLVPNTELATLLGCNVSETGVQVNAGQQTSVANVYCAGEPTGIAGVDAAVLQGEIAGLTAAGKAGQAARLHRKRDAQIAFGQAMDRAFALRNELRNLPQPDTIVCRCEDVRFAQLQEQVNPQNDWTNAKLQTRCGMGPCQGRVCGPALNALFGWRNSSVRSPIFPIPLEALCSAPFNTEEVQISDSQENSR
jgi:NADPH-dependent 2,4-dienoyl-CoA reductase/sulfur reductase-like enzyme